MSVSLENLANLRDGSYYLSDNGEVKKAGAWTKFKYTFNLGHSRERAHNLINEIKNTLYVSAGNCGEVFLNQRIEELNLSSGVKASDIKAMIADFKETNQNKILSNSAKKYCLAQINATLKNICKDSPIRKTQELKDLFLKACKPLIDNPDVKDTPNGMVIDKQKLSERLLNKVNNLQNDLALLISREGENFTLTGGYAHYLEKALFDEKGNRIGNGIEHVKDPKTAFHEMVINSIDDTEENLVLVRRNTEYLANQLNKDPDLDEIIFKHYPSFIRNSGGVPRSIEKIQQSLDSLKTNLKELEELKQYSKNGYKSAVKSLYNIGVTGLPKGVIPKCLELARYVSLDPILSLGTKPSLEELYKAASFIRQKLNDIYNKTGLNKLDSPDVKQVANELINNFMLSQTDKAQRSQLAQTFSSQNFYRFNAFCDEAVDDYNNFSGTPAEQTLQIGLLTDIQATISGFKLALWSVMTKPNAFTFSYKGDLDPNNEAGTVLDEVYTDCKKLINNDVKNFTNKHIKGASVQFLQTQMNKQIEKSAHITRYKTGKMNMAEAFSNISSPAINGMMTISILENMKNYSNDITTQFNKEILDLNIGLPGGKKLSTDYNTALDELAHFVLKTDKKYEELPEKEQKQVQIICSLLNKQFVEKGFDGIKLSLDDKQKKNFFGINNRAEKDSVEFNLDTDRKGSIIIRSNYKSDIASILDNNGKIIVANDGSNFKSTIEVIISQDELNRLAELDYKNTNSESMTSILNDGHDNKIKRMLQAVNNNYIVNAPVNTELSIDTDKATNEAAPDLYEDNFAL